MKTLARFCLCLSGVILLCLMAGCTSEVETTPGETPGQPENPQAKDPNRRSVVISLQNKLILVKGTPESRAVTRDGIAEDDENRIGSFDIYAFGSDKEEGPYTFQERFAYRMDAGTLPAGASPLELKADEAAGKVNVVFYPRKGLFTKFYCVANQNQLTDAAGNAYTDYTPLQQTTQAGMGDVVTAPGTPTENDFIRLSTPLIQPTGFLGDVLLAPLPMSGANAQPTDLREYSMGTYVRLNISLVRAVARFDVVNDEVKSHFTITDIAMGNGRQGVTLFPIRPIGDVPATPGQLITYPYRPFDGLNANAGVTTKAFYCYPCKAVDEGFLILKGLYAVNMTDKKEEVSYRIPFERVTDGDGMRIEINHNHRYTVQITEADPFELKANIRLVNWETGDDIEDYVPDNGLETIVVDDLMPADETTYDGNTNIVTLLLKKGSSFTVTTGSNAGVDRKLTYYGGATDADWLKIEEVEIPASATRADATKQVKYKVSFNESYTGDSYPRGILRLMDKAGGSEEVVLIDKTYVIPTVESTGEAMSPSVNSWVENEKTLYLVQTTADGTFSTGKLTVTSAGGSKIELSDNSGITVSPTSSTLPTQEYTFQWAATDATDLVEKALAVKVLNALDDAKIENITVKLLPNQISELKLTPRTEFNLSDVKATTANLTMPITKGQFTLTMDNYSEPVVSQHPSWLKVIAPISTRSTPTSTTTSFTFELDENAANFDDNTPLVFTNASGGTGMTVNIAKVFKAPTITTVSMDPTVNSYSSGRLNLYQLKSGYSSTATLKVYSLGGSKLEIPSGVTINQTQSTAKEQNYVIKYNVSSFSLSDLSGGTLYVKNLSDNTKSQSIAVTFKSSVPVLSAPSGVTYSRGTSTVVLHAGDGSGTFGQTGLAFTFTSPIGYNSPTLTGTNAKNYSQVNMGSQSVSGSNTYTPFTIAFKSTATFDIGTNLYYYNFAAKDSRFPDYQIDLYMDIPVYKGRAPYRSNGLYVTTPYADNWYRAAIENNDATAKAAGWYVPHLSELHQIAGWANSTSNDYTGPFGSSASYTSYLFPYTGWYWSIDTLSSDDTCAWILNVFSSQQIGHGHPGKGGNGNNAYFHLVHKVN